MYFNINNKKTIQMEVVSSGASDYTYNFKEIEGVLGIKLISYSIPKPRFNISKNNNNLKYSINDVDKEIEIPIGFYNIDKLLKNINKNDDFEIKNVNQHLVLESKQDIELDNSYLITNNLGFEKNMFGKNIIANKSWDLRLPDKLFLYIKNINKDLPLGILYFNEIFSSEILFEEPIKLSQLDIILLDENGFTHDFSNLYYSLSFNLDIIIKNESNLISNESNLISNESNLISNEINTSA